MSGGRTRVILRPSPLEFGLNREHYEGLVPRLAAAGFDAELERPLEERGGMRHAAVELAVHLGGYADEVALGLLANLIYDGLKKLPRPQLPRRGPDQTPPELRGSRRVGIYGPSGELLKEVVLANDDNDERVAR